MNDDEMRIKHLALNVSDAQRSARFYIDTIGLSATTKAEEWGVRVRFDDGFMLALIEGEPAPADVIDRVHFGCALPDGGAVHRARERLAAAGVPEVEWCEEEGYTSVKVADPDGYIVELAWDIQ